MARLLRVVLAVLVLAGVDPKYAFATHIAGGDLNLIHVQGDVYRLRLNLYFDQYRGSAASLDSAALIRIFSRRTNALISSERVVLISNTSVGFSNPDCATGADTLLTARLRYEKLIEMTASRYGDSAGYYAVWDRCCRNRDLANIENAGTTGQLFYIAFPGVLRNRQPFRNSGPTKFRPFSDYACLGRPFVFDFSGEDSDGDSLVYSLAKPWVGYTDGNFTGALPADTLPPQPWPYRQVDWVPGIDVNNQIPGKPSLNIHPETGILTMTPTRVGLFVFAVECREYRDGKPLGLVRRDFQILVVDCKPNSNPTVRISDSQGEPLQDGDTVHVNFDQGKVCLNLRIDDSIPDRLNLTLTAPGLEGYAQIGQTSGETTDGSATFTTEFCVDPCAALQQDVRMVPVNLRISDKACSIPNVVSIGVLLRLVPVGGQPTLSNIVTPNGDGLNDFLAWTKPAPIYQCANGFERLEIHNRWGKRVLETRKADFVWPDDQALAGLYSVSYVYSGKQYRQWVEVVR